MMFEVAWKEINKSCRIVTKRKAFETEAARDSFVEKLYEKDNFYSLIGIR